MLMKKIIIVFAVSAAVLAIGFFAISEKGKKDSGKTPQASAPAKAAASMQTIRHSLRKESAMIPYEYDDKGRYKRILRLKDDGTPLEYIGNEYRDNGNATITDHATGLTWHKAGSSEEIQGDTEIKAYLDDLNNKKFAGYADWRLPTIDELKSLIEPEIQSNDLHISPLLVPDAKEAYRCKSSDNDLNKNAWGVDFKEGKVVPHSYYSFIRAVRP
ncbi:MAG: hypothetical protein BWK80_05695 [Desulfobacteraceae bacterium IS3]|nr:MAG: hypothetical protein BWK80_05695 [Desulfobacteraceae bacterium IS3]